MLAHCNHLNPLGLTFGNWDGEPDAYDVDAHDDGNDDSTYTPGDDPNDNSDDDDNANNATPDDDDEMTVLPLLE